MREIVLDTNAFVAALRSVRDASYELVRSIGQAESRPNISVAFALEYEDVLKRTNMARGLTSPSPWRPSRRVTRARLSPVTRGFIALQQPLQRAAHPPSYHSRRSKRRDLLQAHLA